MPRVSAAHRAARRLQILEAARVCFLRNGFHATTMQDVLAASGLSAGAVYTYFRGKEDIVQAIALEAITEVATVLRPLVDAPGAPAPLYDVMAAAVMTLERLDIERGVPRIAMQVWGEALRSPRLAEDVKGIVESVAPLLARLVERHREQGSLPPDVPVQATARALLGLIPGFIVQRVLTGLETATYLEGLRVLLPSTVPAAPSTVLS
ncbi:MAG: TetR/AcrR family transcriptional regulator [Mycobacteriales bacterium]